MSRLYLIFFLLFFIKISIAQPYQANWQSLDTRKIPDWYPKAKFGIFIHWGTYSVPAFCTPGVDAYSEWYWMNLYDESRKYHAATHDFHIKNYGKGFEYKDFAPLFKAELYDPTYWASIFKKSGAKYVVLTSKHHEGYCLWDSREANESWKRPWNSVVIGPKRDLLGELTNAINNAGLRMGIYYSLYEWFNPLYLKEDKTEYVEKHLMPQFKDVVTKYKPQVIFSDGEWEFEDTLWQSEKLLAWLYNDSPVGKEVVVNDRWGKGTRHKHPSTYFTSEYGSGLDPSVVWEENRGMGQSYGYNRMENINDYKSSHDLIIMLLDVVSRGGNLLLNIGPTADGRIPVIMQQRLLDIGQWLDIYGEAIYETTPYKVSRQWSTGKIPDIKKAEWQADYDVSQMVKKSKDRAHIEVFYTQKGEDLYIILPQYVDNITIKDLKLDKKQVVSLFKTDKIVKWKANTEGVRLDLSTLKPSDILHDIFVLKIQGFKNKV
jgi:alpha-L-fucosidase